MKRAACTIVSLNYIPFARTLCDSYLKFHPDQKFYVLLVDRLPSGLDLSEERFELLMVEDLSIPNFSSVAFRYDILELNTTVKPTFLKTLLAHGIEQLLYFDPDIFICAPVDSIFSALDKAGIVITPHCLSPNEELPNEEANLLYTGPYNLGFIGVSKTEESDRFLGVVGTPMPNAWICRALDRSFC